MLPRHLEQAHCAPSKPPSPRAMPWAPADKDRRACRVQRKLIRRMAFVKRQRHRHGSEVRLTLDTLDLRRGRWPAKSGKLRHAKQFKLLALQVSAGQQLNGRFVFHVHTLCFVNLNSEPWASSAEKAWLRVHSATRRCRYRGTARRTGRFRRGTVAALDARRGRHRRRAGPSEEYSTARHPLVRLMAELTQQTGCNRHPGEQARICLVARKNVAASWAWPAISKSCSPVAALRAERGGRARQETLFLVWVMNQEHS